MKITQQFISFKDILSFKNNLNQMTGTNLHTIEVCETCENIIRQCRCPGPHEKVKRGTCSDCKKKKNNKRDPVHDYILKADSQDLKEMMVANGLDPEAETKWVKDIIDKNLGKPDEGK